MIIAYTDGSTWRKNPGPMAWAVVYVENSIIVGELQGALYHGTNNRAEILGVIWALENEDRKDLVIRTDSIAVLNVATGIWRAKANMELWDRFNAIINKRDSRGLATQFQYVKGHGMDVYNRRADELAKTAASRAAECLK
jgi:ribonuclease HI